MIFFSYKTSADLHKKLVSKQSKYFHGFMGVSLCSKTHAVLAKTISFIIDT